jgi:hypothetical protein
MDCWLGTVVQACNLSFREHRSGLGFEASQSSKFMKPHLNQWLGLVECTVIPAMCRNTNRIVVQAGLCIKWDPVSKTTSAKGLEESLKWWRICLASVRPHVQLPVPSNKIWIDEIMCIQKNQFLQKTVCIFLATLFLFICVNIDSSIFTSVYSCVYSLVWGCIL